MRPTKPPIVIQRNGTPLVCVRGMFYRAVDRAYENSALYGSRSAGRYLKPDMRTLYLSSSPEGVAAAMIAHTSDGSPELKVLAFEVTAERIADLRDADAMARLGVDPEEAAADWQGELAAGRVPRSWAVRETLENAGATGLINLRENVRVSGTSHYFPGTPTGLLTFIANDARMPGRP